MNLTLYHYWRSSSSWRVRMALAYKGLSPAYAPVDLLAGVQTSPEHLKRNPSGLVPTLQVEANGKVSHLSESVAIIEWLEEIQPEPALLPRDPLERARVRQLVQIINADTQPVQNLRVLRYYSTDEAERAAWARHWIEVGFTAYERLLSETAGRFSFGDSVTMADLFLAPQCYNAGRFNLDLTPFPLIRRIYAEIIKQPFCQMTAPDRFDPAS